MNQKMEIRLTMNTELFGSGEEEKKEAKCIVHWIANSAFFFANAKVLAEQEIYLDTFKKARSFLFKLIQNKITINL